MEPDKRLHTFCMHAMSMILKYSCEWSVVVISGLSTCPYTCKHKYLHLMLAFMLYCIYSFLAGSESDSGWISVNDVELKDVERKDNEMSEHLRQTAEGSRNKRKAKIIRKRRREEERRESIANGKPGEIDNQIKRQRMERAVAISQTRVCF